MYNVHCTHTPMSQEWRTVANSDAEAVTVMDQTTHDMIMMSQWYMVMVMETWMDGWLEIKIEPRQRYSRYENSLHFYNSQSSIVCVFGLFRHFDTLWLFSFCWIFDVEILQTINDNFVHKVIIYNDYLCRLSRACPCSPWRPPPPSTWSTTDSPTTAWSGARGATSPSPPPTER